MKQIIKQHKTDIIKGALILLWGIVCFAFFQTKFCYHFYLQEQNQLFLLDSNYISSYFQHPAWLACLAGDFLTQFYYYIAAGPIILTLALLTLGDFTRRALERAITIKGKERLMGWIAFAIAILFMSLEARLCLDHSYHLSSIIAIIGGIGLFLVLDICSGWLFKGRTANFIQAVNIALVIIFGFLAYTLFGFGFWFFFVLELLRNPGLCKQYNLKMWYSGILSAMNFVVLLIFIIPLAPGTYNINIDDALLYPGTGKWISYDEAMKYEQVLALDNEYYFGHYDKVIKMYENIKGEKSEEMTFFYCLALEQQGQLVSKLTSMEKPVLGTFYQISDKTPLYTIKMINELYYLIGDMTYTERAAIMACTFSPNNRNARMIKRLAEANLVNGDMPAAMKYLRLLSKTLVYSGWAKHHMPETMSPDVKMEIARKAAFTNKTDKIRLGDNCYVILTQLLDSNKDNTVALDYLLCSDMLAHDPKTFVDDVEKYGTNGNVIFEQIYASAKDALGSEKVKE